MSAAAGAAAAAMMRAVRAMGVIVRVPEPLVVREVISADSMFVPG